MQPRKFARKLRRSGIEKESLMKEAETLRQTAKRARDLETRQEFEAMAERREFLVHAIDELEADPPADEPVQSKKD